MNADPEWKAIPGSNYLVCRDGRIRHKSRKRAIATRLYKGRNRPGFKMLNGKQGSMVDVLVCRAFNGPPQDASQVRVIHIDGDKTNDNASNLRWATHAEATQNGRIKGKRKRGAPAMTPQSSLDGEEWKDVHALFPEVPTGCLKVSNHGRVWRKQTTWHYTKDESGSYHQLMYAGNHLDGLHRIVWRLFGDCPLGDLQVNHKNFNKSDNHVTNLEVASASENVQHARDNGRFVNGKTKRRKVIQIDPESGEVLGRFASANAAAKSIGKTSRSGILGAAEGRLNHAYGYAWALQDETGEASKDPAAR